MISVIVPIYNAEKYLSKCIESICNQTYSDLEIILVNDGSTDQSYEICKQYQKLDKRIKVIHKENEGLVCARKSGLKSSTGEYIAFVDADDWIEATMYEEMYYKMLEEDVSIVMSGRYEDTGEISREVYHGIPEARYDKESLKSIVYPYMIVNQDFFEWGIFPGLWDKLFRRNSIYEFQFQVENMITMGEDAACVYPCILNTDSIYIMHKCYYHYRQGTNTMVKKKENPDLERYRYHILYQSVRQQFEVYKNIYDLRNQWEEYLLFLMLPRADSLYKGFEYLDYLYPFPMVKKEAKIILYGAGTYGQRLYHYLMESGFCQVVMWVDRNYEQLKLAGLPVSAPSDIEKGEFDFIVMTISFAKARRALQEELSERFGIEKIAVMDENLVKSRESLQAFGLIQKEE